MISAELDQRGSIIGSVLCGSTALWFSCVTAALRLLVNYVLIRLRIMRDLTGVINGVLLPAWSVFPRSDRHDLLVILWNHGPLLHRFAPTVFCLKSAI